MTVITDMSSDMSSSLTVYWAHSLDVALSIYKPIFLDTQNSLCIQVHRKLNWVKGNLKKLISLVHDPTICDND